MKEPTQKSIWEGFSRLSYSQRVARVAELTGFETAGAGLAESCVEDALGYITAPRGIAAYTLIDGRDVVTPMAVEETSIIAAASAPPSFFTRMAASGPEQMGG